MNGGLQQWRIASGVQSSTAIAMQMSVWVMGGVYEAGQSCAKLRKEILRARWLAGSNLAASAVAG